ncbi:auxin response factor 15-like isoform X1 [Canna indica]|uniref:Auxin response factor n=1 Tax=Canna indica TaxID=4628 RepID=A0AAQ3QPT8_9LILI|nr:auxin response factor 15-like isoform X1 [Canna indica]
MGIDLNTIDEEEEEEPERPAHHGAPPPAATTEGAFQATSICLELWHACAGPRIWLPKKGSLVVYLPQGHIEQLEDGGGRGGFCCRDLPPHVFCRVVDVKLHADAATDDVYAQLSLIAVNEDFEGKLKKGEVEGNKEEEEDVDCLMRSSKPHMFCKTLTASDTSTHGGFSVPRRAAEDCFPPLDYKLQRPSQELTAKDLHGTEWRFRHIYRGQPRRHLLTTGWSAFVNRKKLLSGDAVLFVRGNDGELRLGIRRATQFKSTSPLSARLSENSNLATLSTVANAVPARKVFHVCYSPRASSSDFIVPYWKFAKSFNSTISVGMRFRMIYESDDATERRSTGLITGTSEVDPVRWPGSKWRCLLVNWDDDGGSNGQNRISPWEIEPTGSILSSGSLITTSCKRAKISFPSVNMDYPIPNGNGCLDLRESASFQKVLQGQEFTRFRTPNSTGMTAPHVSEIGIRQYSEDEGCSAAAGSRVLNESVPGDRVPIPHGKSDFSFDCTGFSESARFQVLQGQEVFSKFPPLIGVPSDAHAWNGACGMFDCVHISRDKSRLPVASLGYVTLVQQSMPSVQVSLPSSALMFQEANPKNSLAQSAPSMKDQASGENSCFFAKSNGSDSLHRDSNFSFWPPAMGFHLTNQQQKIVHAPVSDSKLGLENEQNISRNSCRLFGFSLTENIPLAKLATKSLPASATSTLNKVDTAFPNSMPQIPDKPVGCSCTGLSTRYALCAAPF